MTHTHSMRWHARYHTSGTGHLYQGRSKSFPVQGDDDSIRCVAMSNGIRCGASWQNAPKIGAGQACGGVCTAMISRVRFCQHGPCLCQKPGCNMFMSHRPRRKWKRCVARCSVALRLVRRSGRKERRPGWVWVKRCGSPADLRKRVPRPRRPLRNELRPNCVPFSSL